MLILQAGEAHASDISTVLGDSLVILVSFLILLWLLQKYAFKPVMAIVEKRQLAIEEQVASAQKLETSAKESAQTAQNAIATAQEKAQTIVAKANESGEKIKADALQSAREEIVKLREQANQSIAKDREQMLTQLHLEVSTISVDLAKRILKREINEQDHQRLIQDFIEGLDV